MDNVHEGHRERLRERYIKSGFESFAQHEVLEFLLFYGLKIKDTNPLAHALIKRFGSVANVLNADLDELARVDGVGMNCAILINMLPKIFGIYQRESNQNEKKVSLKGTQAAGEFAKTLFLGQSYEAVYLISMNSKNQLIAADLIHEGSFDEVIIKVDQIIRQAMLRRAAKAVLTHNHPGGSENPSNSDRVVTDKIQDALNIMNIELFDHIIVYGNGFTSFRENNYLRI